MDLTPKLIEEAEFRETRKGYDRDQVDDFLEEAAASVAKLLSELAEARQRAAAAEAKLAAAGRGAPPATAAPAGPDPKALEDNTEELKRTLVLAQRTADAAIREARAEASRLQGEAQEKSSRQVAEAEARAQQTVLDADQEAERRRTEAQGRLISEIQTLEATREQLRTDANLIERHVEEQRQQLRTALQELQRLLDDPEGLRLAPAPPHRDVPLPDFVGTPTADAPPAEGAPAAAAAPAPEPATDGGSQTGQPLPPTEHVPAAAASAAPDRTEDQEPAVAGSPVYRSLRGDSEAAARDEPADETADETEGPAVEDTPPTQAVPQLVGDADEDAFLAELRKAMTDSEPLGPRDTAATSATPAVDRRGPDGGARSRPRFGRRR